MMHENIMELMWSTGHLSGSNAEYVEELYEDYLSDPESVPEQWRTFFDSLASAVMENANSDVSHASIRRDFQARSFSAPDKQIRIFVYRQTAWVCCSESRGRRGGTAGRECRN